jgi:alpha,alpha-trehalase
VLDAARGGYFSVEPAGQYQVNRSYRADTNVLDTTFTLSSGQVRLTDLMPIHARQAGHRGYDVGSLHRILRLAEVLAGEVDLEFGFKPTFDYARGPAGLSLVDGGALAQGGESQLVLAAPGWPLEVSEDGTVRGRIHLRSGDRRWLALTDAAPGADASLRLPPDECAAQLQATLDFWQEWSAGCTYRGPYRREVVRSVLALKLLTYEPSGAVIAAPSASLPEDIGGVRNWDYRYTWLRDSALILYSLMTVGYQGEATDFLEWLCRTESSDPHPDRQIMYSITGERDLQEIELGHLRGYCGSQPVRIGNGAARQNQLDIYGDVLTAAYLHFRGAPGAPISTVATPQERPMDPDTWAILRPLVEQAARRWQEPDNGIWEVRGGPQQFLYSRLMCWAAVDRGVRLAEHYGLPAPLDEWRQTRTAIHDAILTEGYNAGCGAFTQAFGSNVLDASALYIPLVGLLPPTDQRVQSTVERIRNDLTRDGLVYRYRAGDGLPGGEGTFSLCSLWLVDNLALGGRLDEAHDLFERILSFANDVGLLSEEIAPSTGQMLGNFPQGFTHMAVIGAAVNLAKAARHGPEAEPENEAERAHRARPAAEQGHTARKHRPV